MQWYWMMSKRNLSILILFLGLGAPVLAADLSGSIYMDNFRLSPVLQPSSLSDAAPSVETPSAYAIRIPGDEPSNSLSLKMFPKNLGRNFTSLFSNRNLTPLLAGIAISGASSSLDDSVEDYFEGRNTHTLFANTGAQLGRPYILAPAIGALFLTGLHSDNQRFKAFSYALAQGYVLNAGITLGLKEVTGRTRPNGSNALSFPSGHSADAFMAATIVDQFYGHKAGMIAYGVAGLVAASRLKSNVHWLSDVTAGATIGYIIGRTVSRNMGSLQLSRNITIAPAVNPLARQYGFSLGIQLP